MHTRRPGFPGKPSCWTSAGPRLKHSALASVSLALALSVLSACTGCGSGVASSVAPQAPPTAPTASALGPQLGYIWIASDQTLRPVLGVAGSSQIGKSVVPAAEYVGAVTSATAKLAILQGADGSFDLMTLPSGSPASLGLTLPAGAKLRISPLAAAALAFTPGAKSASLITGLPSTPKVQTVAAPASISDAAVSDIGAVAFESSRSLWVTALNGSAVTLASIGAPGGLSFLPTHDDLLFADSGADTLTLIRSTTGNPSRQTISTAGSTSGLLRSPVAVGVSSSGRWALVANSGNKNAIRLDLTTFATTAVACACQPTLAEPLADDGAFRVTSLASGPNWLVNASLATPGALFIPAIPSLTNAPTIASALTP